MVTCNCVCFRDTNHIESTEVSNAGLGRRPDKKSTISNAQAFKLFKINNKS